MTGALAPMWAFSFVMTSPRSSAILSETLPETPTYTLRPGSKIEFTAPGSPAQFVHEKHQVYARHLTWLIELYAEDLLAVQMQRGLAPSCHGAQQACTALLNGPLGETCVLVKS